MKHVCHVCPAVSELRDPGATYHWMTAVLGEITLDYITLFRIGWGESKGWKGAEGLEHWS